MKITEEIRKFSTSGRYYWHLVIEDKVLDSGDGIFDGDINHKRKDRAKRSLQGFKKRLAKALQKGDK